MQTAVEWLSNKIDDIISEELRERVELLKIEAKEMENKQHKETFKQSRKANRFELGMPLVWDSREQYYNETFKK